MNDESPSLNLSECEHCVPWYKDYAREAFREGNGEDFAHTTDNHRSLFLVRDNLRVLKRRGIYEEALVAAFTATHSNNAGWPLPFMEFMFGEADRAKLREAGDPLPSDGPFTIYRGVSHVGHRRGRGFSWTLSLDCACWFAMRYPKDDFMPAVYVANIGNDEMYCYTNQRNEQEIITRPRSCKRLKISHEEIQERAAREVERRKTKKQTLCLTKSE